MKLKGKQLVCDRCGAAVFLKYIKTQEMDGGFSDGYDVYEDEPKGWTYLHSIGNLCPACSEVYASLLKDFCKNT